MISLGFCFRIVLDEAHTIRNRQTEMSRSCCALQGTHRWAMTGTPIVNSADDVFQLFKFLWFRRAQAQAPYDSSTIKPYKPQAHQVLVRLS